MKMLKRTLALMLALIMMFSAVPFNAYATESTDEPSVPTEAPVDVPESTETEDIADDTADNDPNAVTTSLDDGILTTALTIGTKPADGTTTGMPFIKSTTGGSNSFRIPALVTLSDGTLVAAADARWNTTYDGGGLDTIVSRSEDNGTTWNYTFANYLGDNGNTYNGSGSTAFIDPALAVTKDDTIYMLVDLYPYGVALNGSGNTAPVTGTGFDGKGRLLLSGNNHSSYDYYLENGKIYSTSGSEVSGYTVDGKFNLYKNESFVSNLFFSDSPYKVTRTGFLYLTKSTDKGATWSDPTLLNLKNSSELVCLVAPGRGLVTKNGNIIFPVYSYNGNQNSQTMGYISMDAATGTWSRSTSMTGASWSSESAVVELSDGTLRFFYRNGTTNLCYVDYNNGWGTPVTMTSIDTNSNCQISAISYSKTVDGKQLILVSCPTGPSEAGSDQSGASYRLNGKIFAFTVEEDRSMTKVGSVSVTSSDNQFMYSCLTEYNDGTIGILFENCESGWGTGHYYTMSYAEYDLAKHFGLTLDEDVVEPEEPEVPEVPEDVTLPDAETGIEITAPGLEKVEISAQKAVIEETKVSKTYSITLNDGNYTEAAKVKIPYDKAFDGFNNFVGYVNNDDGTRDSFKVEVVDGFFIGTVPHFSTVTIEASNTTVTVRIPVNGTSDTYKDVTGNHENNASIGDETVAKMSVKGTTVEGGTEETVATSIATDTSYYIKDSNGKYLNSSAEWVDSIDAAAQWTATKSGSNYTLKTGSNTYTYLLYWGYLTTSTNSSYATSFKFSNSQFTYTYYGSTSNLGSAVTLTTTAPVAATEVVFTGVKAGTTKAKVGTTTYNITVYEEVDVKINYICDGTGVATGTVKVPSDAATTTTVELPASVVVGSNTYKVNTTTLTLANGTSATYDVPVTLVEGEEVSVAAGNSLTETLDYTLSDGQYVVWTSADTSFVSAAPNYTAAGKYTNQGIIIGNKETDDPVLVTGTVYNADGSIAHTGKYLVTVTEGTDNSIGAGKSKDIYINIIRIQNCTVYYAINGGELVEVTDDMLTQNADGSYELKVPLMNEQYTGGFQISFFAAPDEGYALTYMSSTNSDKQYYTLSDGNADGVGGSAWPFVSTYDYTKFDALATKPGGNDTSVFDTTVGIRWGLAERNFTVAQMKTMFANAIAKGCDGILVFTKNGTDGLNTEIEFVAQKLPEMEKKIVSVNGAAYTDGMHINIGDTIDYEIYIYSPVTNSTYGNITYSNIKLNDPLTGDSWATSASQTVSSTYTGTTTIADSVSKASGFTYVNSAGETVTYTGTTSKYVYGTSLTLNLTNFSEAVQDGKITNTADLTYAYKGQYSNGTSSSKSSAVAEVEVKLPEYVIDFGLPVTITLDEAVIGTGTTITHASAKYGTVTWSGRSFTYTPTQVLQGVEVVNLTLSGNARLGYAVRIYPATTVYYGEKFINFGTGWTTEGAPSPAGNQATEVLGNSSYYGFDPAYAGTADKPMGASDGTAKTATAIGSSATFSFTGNGIQVFANTTPNTGYVSVHVKNRETGNIVKMSIVDTVVNGTNSTGGQIGQNLDGLPVVSLVDLTGIPHATYDVTITKVMDSEPVFIDGIRVFGTIDESKYDDPSVTNGTNPNPYLADDEDNPDFYEVRDMVLKAINIQDSDSKDYKTLYNQIYADTIEVGASAVITNASAEYGTVNRQDLLDKGPKNELYLFKGDKLTFNVTTDRVMQLGLKAPEGSATFKLNGAENDTTLYTAVDMFYKIAEKGGTTHTITVENTGENILSVTLLKICDDPSFAFAPLTEDNIKAILADAGYTEETPDVPDVPETPDEPEVPETTEPEVPETTEPAKPTKPTEPTKPSKPTKPTEPTKPSKPTKPTEPTKPTKPTEPQKPGKPGNNGNNKPGKEEKTYTLKITFVNLLGKKVGTATITTTNGVVSAYEIVGKAPAGRMAIWLIPVTLRANGNTSITVPVI